MKKLVISLLLVLLCACTNNEIIDNTPTEEKQYIEPVNNVEVFEFLNQKTKDKLLKANSGEEMKSRILECLGKELLDFELIDYNGNTVKISDYKDDNLLIEISASWCTHCMKQVSDYNDEIIKAYPNLKVIQYFNEGDKDDIDSFYKQVGKAIPKDIIVIPENDEFSKQLLSRYNPEFYPGFLIFNKGILTYMRIAELTKEQLDNASGIAFNNELDLNELVDDNGVSVLSYKRSENDLINDLCKESKEKLKELDNDEYTKSITFKFMGKDFAYNDQLEDDSEFKSEIDFMDYEDLDTVIFFINKLDEDVITMINDYTDIHSELSVLVVDITDEITNELKDKLSAPVCSVMNQIPKTINEISFITYPSCVFVEKGTITGAYSNIANIEMLNKATDTFMGEGSIALKKNN